MSIENNAGNVLQEVLENAAMLFVEPPCDKSPTPNYDWQPVGCRIDYHGPQNGELSLWLDKPLAVSCAANMLGIEEKDPKAETKSYDAIKELLNMVAGNLFTHEENAKSSYEFGLPQMVESLEKAQLDNLDKNSKKIWIEAEGSVVLLILD